MWRGFRFKVKSQNEWKLSLSFRHNLEIEIRIEVLDLCKQKRTGCEKWSIVPGAIRDTVSLPWWQASSRSKRTWVSEISQKPPKNYPCNQKYKAQGQFPSILPFGSIAFPQASRWHGRLRFVLTNLAQWYVRTHQPHNVKSPHLSQHSLGAAYIGVVVSGW